MKQNAGRLLAALCTLGVCAASGLQNPVIADSNSDYAMQCYNRGDYKNAGMYFAQSLRANPVNPKAILYSALCCRKMGNEDAAKNGFHTIVQLFPATPEAAMAKQEIASPGSSSAGRTAPSAASTTWTRTATSSPVMRTTTSSTPVPLSSEDSGYIVVRRQTPDTNNARAGVAASLARIPSNVKRAVLSGGCKIVITPTILEYKPELATEKPRGYSHGGGYDNCPAMFQGGANEIMVAERWGWKNGPARPGRIIDFEEALGHEFGHAFDSYMGLMAQGGHRRDYWSLTETNWFTNTYHAELEKMTNQQRTDVAYYTQPGHGGASELFAELFASLYSGAPNAEQRKLATFFPRTRAKIAQLAGLTSFSAESIAGAIPELATKGVSESTDE